jgi:hypothetical protein
LAFLAFQPALRDPEFYRDVREAFLNGVVLAEDRHVDPKCNRPEKEEEENTDQKWSHFSSPPSAGGES